MLSREVLAARFGESLMSFRSLQVTAIFAFSGLLALPGGKPLLAQNASGKVYNLVSVSDGMELHAPDGNVVLKYVTVRLRPR
jgi:hypothetical protein